VAAKPEFVGRRAEFDALIAALDGARSGRRLVVSPTVTNVPRTSS
jgi:hypothetical protein